MKIFNRDNIDPIKNKVLGIDLGTTNSCVAFIELGKPEIVPNSEGKRTTPSIVGITKKNEHVVGDIAKNQAISNSENTVRSIKCHMGKPGYIVKLNDKEYKPHEISSEILKKLKSDAEKYIGEKIEKAVITVPAYFNDSQRFATKEAGKLAGLDVIRLINEPTAAALAYGFKTGVNDRKILIYDLGGGTFDVSILNLEAGVLQVLATSGDTNLGGDDFDQVIINHLVYEFKSSHDIDLSHLPDTMQRLKEAAERCKIELSSLTNTNINLPYLYKEISLEIDIDREKFEKMTRDLVQKTGLIMKKSLDDANLSIEEIDEVVLVGGSTRIPAVVKLVEEFMGKKPRQSINPDEVVALGAAIQGGLIENEPLKCYGAEVRGSDILLLDTTSITLSFEAHGDIAVPIIPRNTTFPTKESSIFTTIYDNQDTVRGNILQGEEKKASKNVTIGELVLTDIPPAPKGIPKIEVTFDIDANEIIIATAKDLNTGNKKSVTINRPLGLNN